MILAKNIFGNKSFFMMMHMSFMAQVMHYHRCFMYNFFVIHNNIFFKALEAENFIS